MKNAKRHFFDYIHAFMVFLFVYILLGYIASYIVVIIISILNPSLKCGEHYTSSCNFLWVYVPIFLSIIFGIIFILIFYKRQKIHKNIIDYLIKPNNIPDKSIQSVQSIIPIINKFCSKCGQEIEKEALFCAKCGTKIIKKNKSKKFWIFLGLVVIILGLLSIWGFKETPTNSTEICKYSSLSKENVLISIQEHRVDNNKSIFSVDDKLNEYAQARADDLEGKSQELRKDAYGDDFYKWYNENTNDQRVRLKNIYRQYYYNLTTPCSLIESTKKNKVINSQMLEQKYSKIGIGVKNNFVYIILAEVDDSPVSQPASTKTTQPASSAVKKTTCNYDRQVEQMKILGEAISKYKTNILNLQSQVRQLEEELKKPEIYDGYYDYVRSQISQDNTFITDNEMNTKLRQTDLDKVNNCILFDDQWVETARKYY